MKLLEPSLVSISDNRGISRSDISMFLSGLVPGQTISSTTVYKMSEKLGFKGKVVPFHQVGHFYLLLTLRELWGYYSYAAVIEETKITSHIKGDSGVLSAYWLDVKTAGGFSKVTFNNLLTKIYVTNSDKRSD